MRKKTRANPPPLVPAKSPTYGPPIPPIFRELASAGWSFRVVGDDGLAVTPVEGHGPIRRIESDAIGRHKAAIVKRVRWQESASSLVILAGNLIGFKLRVEGGALVITPAPTDPDVIEGLRRHKRELLRLLDCVGGSSDDAVDLVCERVAIVWADECPEEAQAALERFGPIDIIKAAPTSLGATCGA